ncbi:MAG: hypothetical protein ACR2LH_07615, partial [Thermoleophilaceae bacterium]
FGVERDDRARIGCSAHYFDHRDGLVAAGFYEQGLRLLDVRDPRRIRQVGFHIPRLAMAWGALFAPTDPTGSTVYVLNHTRGIEIVGIDRAAMKPIRRRPTVLRRTPRGGLEVGAFVSDGLERARRGQRVRIRVEAARVSGPVARGVAVEARLSSQYTDVRPPRGAGYDRATRTVRYTIPRLKRFSERSISARVSRRAPVGSILEVIAFARAPGDRLPIATAGSTAGASAGSVAGARVAERALPHWAPRAGRTGTAVPPVRRPGGKEAEAAPDDAA